MRSLHSIIESILDNDETVIQNPVSDAAVSLLKENGIYYASEGLSRHSIAKNKQLASFKNDELCFFTEFAATEVVIDYKLAYSFLKKLKLKSIEAPKVTIINSNGDFSVFGTIKTNVLTLTNCNSHIIKNLYVVECREFYKTVIKNSRARFDVMPVFDNVYQGLSGYSVIYVDEWRPVIFDNCTLDLNTVEIHGEGINFKNTGGLAVNFSVYDPSLFDSTSDCSDELFSLFDDKYEFTYWSDKGGQHQETRRTSTLRKLLAFFGNKHYYCPDTNPYKVIGRLKDLCDLSKFGSCYGLQYRDNNYAITFTKDKSHALRLQILERFKYQTNEHLQLPLEQTKDGYYVVVFNEK